MCYNTLGGDGDAGDLPKSSLLNVTNSFVKGFFKSSMMCRRTSRMFRLGEIHLIQFQLFQVNSLICLETLTFFTKHNRFN